MATLIKYFDPSRLRQEEARMFHEQIATLVTPCTQELIAPAKANHEAKLTAFTEALRPDAKSQITAEISALHNDRCQLFVNSRTLTRAMTGHFDPAVAAVAQKAYDIYRKYGDVHLLPHQDASGTLKELLEDLYAMDNAAEGEAPSAEHNCLAFIGLKDWADEIQRVNNAFIAAFMRRLEEQSTIVTGLTSTTRKEVDGAYLEEMRVINAVITLYGDEGMAAIVAQINDLIDYYNTLLKDRHGTGGTTPDPTTPDGDTTPDEGETPDEGGTTPTPNEGGTTPDEGGDEGGETPTPTPGGGDDNEEVVG